MLVVTATLSIAPGHPATVTAAAREQLQASPALRHCHCLLAAEIREVNTLLGLFADAALETLLADVRAWLAAVQAAPAGRLLRHVQVDVHHTTASSLQLRQLQASAGVLAQVFRGAPSTAQGSALEALTGLQQRYTLLTPVNHQDDAVALARASLEAGADVADSGLWLRVLLSPFESNP